MATANRLNLVRQLDLFTLKLFLSAVEEQQIGLAANREHIAPSTATKRIQAFEDLVGLPLLQRGRHGVAPTAGGEVVARHARTILEELDSLRAELVQMTTDIEGELVVSAAHSIIADLLAPALRSFIADWPSVVLTLRELDNAEVVSQVALGACDVGVFATVGDLGIVGPEVRVLRTEKLVAVLPRTHPLGECATLTFPDLIAQDLIATRTIALALAELAATDGSDAPVLRHVVRTGEVALGMVRAGLGITIVPIRLLDHAGDAEMLVRDIDEPWAVRRIHAAVRSDRATGPTARAFIRSLVEAARPAE